MVVFIDGPSHAQTRTITAEEALANARETYRNERPKPRCGTSNEDEIVVCGPDNGERWRVPGSSQDDPASRQALRTGVPRAPQLNRGSCKGQPGCVVGGWAPPPVYYIDVKALPEAPEGSDADKIAKGEAPAL